MASVNPHLRGIAIAGVLAVVAVGLGMLTLSRQQVSSNAATVPDVIVHKLPLKAAPTVHHASKPKVAPPTPLETVFAKAALAAGLPKQVAAAFADREVVVVTLYSPRSDVDLVSEGEAHAGAVLAGAGYVRVDASTDGTTGLLTKAFGVLSAPTTLVLSRTQLTAPAARLDGFADRETVAQAASNADPTPGGPEIESGWARNAESLCARAKRDFGELGVISTRATVKAVTPEVKTITSSLVTGLSTLAPPPGRKADAAKFVSLARKEASLTLQLMTAAASNDAVATATASAAESAVSAQARPLAISLGAPTCAEPF